MLVFNVTPPFAPVRVERVRMAQAVVGELQYEGWASARPTGVDEVTWRMDYSVLRRGEPLAGASVEYRWWVASEDALAAEAAEEGLRLRGAGGPGLGLWVAERAQEGQSAS